MNIYQSSKSQLKLVLLEEIASLGIDVLAFQDWCLSKNIYIHIKPKKTLGLGCACV